MERLRSRARTLLQSGLAPNTRNTYTTAVRVFEKFRSEHALAKLWPIPCQNLILFIAYCFDKGHSPTTINTYIAGLNYFHKIFSYYDISSVFIIKKLLDGYRRKRRSRDKRAPLTRSILTAICKLLPRVCYNTYEVTLFKALFTVAYFGLFRVSELVVPFLAQTDRVVFRSDLSLGDKYAIIKLNYFKTNQTGNPVRLKIPADDSSVCPVRALTEFMCRRSHIPGPLFVHCDGTPVTRTQFSAVLSKCVHEAHLSNAYKTHSFRIGRATDLALQGLPSTALMKLGRWSSDCFKLYIRSYKCTL